jgi:hypothetical protein
MENKHKKGKAGRPQAKINWKLVDKRCAAQCTIREICAELGIDRSTLLRACKREKRVDFAAYFREKRHGGVGSLRSAQFATALGGNPAMQIWLGKQLLKQSEPKQKHEVGGPNGGPIPVETDDALDLTKLSTDELRTYVLLLRKTKAPAAIDTLVKTEAK